MSKLWGAEPVPRDLLRSLLTGIMLAASARTLLAISSHRDCRLADCRSYRIAAVSHRLHKGELGELMSGSRSSTNERAGGDGGIPVLFHAGRHRPAAPQHERSGNKNSNDGRHDRQL